MTETEAFVLTVVRACLDARACTCHPGDNPPRPCPRKFALSECRKAALSTPAVQASEPTRSQKLADAGFTRRPSLWAMQAREALELIAAPMRPDGTWNRDREACRQLAAEALGRYDDDAVQASEPKP